MLRALDAAGVKVNDIAVRSASLDDVFLTLTGHKAEETRSKRRRRSGGGDRMTATHACAPADLTTGPRPVQQFLGDVWVLTKRRMARIRREPETLSEVTIQPVMFVLMFAYVFGGAIGIPGGGSYHEYLIGGMLGMGLAQTAPGTAVAVVSDMSTGLIDRFRSLPMSRAAVLTARTLADMLTQVIGAAVRPPSGWRSAGGSPAALQAIEAFALALLFGYAFTWAGRLPRDGAAQPRGGTADRVRHLPAADVHLQRLRADPGHAGLAAADRGVEPDVLARGGVPRAVRQPEPGATRCTPGRPSIPCWQ